jgi:hypothetical protein
MVARTCFGITLPSSGSISSAFWEMLNWGAVDRILWMGVLCLVMWCACTPQYNTPIHNILSTAPQLSISQKALGTLPEDGNVMPKHVGVFLRIFLLEILIFKRLTARHFYKSFGVKGLISCIINSSLHLLKTTVGILINYRLGCNSSHTLLHIHSNQTLTQIVSLPTVPLKS